MLTLPRPQLFLIDGYALIYRAFFAMIARPLTTSRGENTSAAWGVANFLLRVTQEYRPEYLAWVHDAGSSFRTETYPEYKATRQKLDDELQDAFDRSLDRIDQLLAAFAVPLIAVEGYEADDVIGTLARQAADQDIHSVIVSGDKDFYQLISKDVSLLNPGRGGRAAVQEEVVTTANASERLGVPPELVTDYLALVGDSSDNVPGVRGIGDKTARKLLEEFGSLDAVLDGAERVTGKRAREALLAEADKARLSRTLVTIQHDVAIHVAFDDLRAGPADASALRQVFSELEFHSLIPKVDALGPADEATAPPVSATGQGTVVQDVSELKAIVTAVRDAGVAGVRVISPEGSGPGGAGDVLGLSLATPDRAWYLPLGGREALDLLTENREARLPPLDDAAMRPVVDLLEDESVPKTGHDVKRDVLALRSVGVGLEGIGFDSMIASFLLDPGKRSHALDVLAFEHFGRTIPSAADIVGKGRNTRSLAEVPVGVVAEYANAGILAALELQRALAPALDDTGLGRLLNEIELPLVTVLAEMEWRGIALDTGQLKVLSEEFRAESERLESSIYAEAGGEFNINSTPQLRHVLFEKLQLPVIKKTKTGASTDAEVLDALAGMGFALPRLLLEYREINKLISTYVDALPKCVHRRTGRVHTSFNQIGAATGRLSSSDPNLQNIPVRTERGARIRRCFVPARGCRFVVADYSQIELRLLAHLSGDAAFIEAFRRGGDIHRETAAIIFDTPVAEVTPEMRGRAKTINFATIYGQGPFALANQLGITRDEARDFIATYFERFAGVRAFLDGTIERARDVGYVETLFGRRRYIPELKDKNFNVRSFGERTAMNSPIQGSAADLIKIAMVDLHRRLAAESLEGGILLQVHDELVVEAPDGEVDTMARIVRDEMEGAAQLEVPLVVDVAVGANWLDAKADSPAPK